MGHCAGRGVPGEPRALPHLQRPQPRGLGTVCSGLTLPPGAGEQTDTQNREVTHSRWRSGAVPVWASPVWLQLPAMFAAQAAHRSRRWRGWGGVERAEAGGLACGSEGPLDAGSQRTRVCKRGRRPLGGLSKIP